MTLANGMNNVEVNKNPLLTDHYGFLRLIDITSVKLRATHLQMSIKTVLHPFDERISQETNVSERSLLCTIVSCPVSDVLFTRNFEHNILKSRQGICTLYLPIITLTITRTLPDQTDSVRLDLFYIPYSK